MSHTLLEAPGILVLLATGRVAAWVSGHLTGSLLHAVPTPGPTPGGGWRDQQSQLYPLNPTSKTRGLGWWDYLSVFWRQGFTV